MVGYRDIEPTKRCAPISPFTAWEILRDVLPVALSTRLLFALLTVVVSAWQRHTGAPFLTLSATTRTPATGSMLDLWNHWDALWYMDLAHLGYNVRGPEGYKNVVFFPLYPLLTRALHDVLTQIGDRMLGLSAMNALNLPYLIAGLLVANLCAVGALCYFYSLVRLDYGQDVARRAVTLLTISPMSIFFAAPYSEGPYVLCVIASFHALRRARWWEAGLWGMLAAAARSPGLTLIIPFCLSWAEAYAAKNGPLSMLAGRVCVAWRGAELGATRLALLVKARTRSSPAVPELIAAPETNVLPTTGRRVDDARTRAGRAEDRAPTTFRTSTTHNLRAQHALRAALPVGLIPLGLGLYMAYLAHTFGDPLLFSHAQRAWLRTLEWPPQTLYLSVARPLADVMAGRFTGDEVTALQDLAYAVLGIIGTYAVMRQLPRVQVAYVWLIWSVLLASPAVLSPPGGVPHSDVLMSLPRMLLMAFPLFTAAAMYRRAYPWLVGLFSLALCVYTVRFLTNGWIA